MSTHDVDVIDLLAGIGPDHPLGAVRDRRAQARTNAQASFEALFEPEVPGAFSYTERWAVATFAARLHAFDRAAEFFADLLGDADPALVDVIERTAADASVPGPAGTYREPGLAAENVPVVAWSPADDARAALGPRLAAALTHAHLLVTRPREASPAALRALVVAGWSANEIVSLSQLVAFLSFQLRAAWGLAVLAANPAPGPATDASSAPADHPQEGTSR